MAKKTWKSEKDLEEVQEETENIGLKKENALNPAKWKQSASNCRRNGVNSAIAAKWTIPDKN